MPTLAAADVERVAELILQVLPGLEAEFRPPYKPWLFPPEPGAIPYSHLVEACKPELPAGKKPHPLVRAGCELLVGQARLELFLKTRTLRKTQSRRDRVLWVRLPGRRHHNYEAPDRPEHRPRKKYRYPRPACAMDV